MNVFQLFGDLLHLLSFIIIVYKLHRDKTCVGVSAKAQEIYLIVFLTRYIDLFFTFISLYNTVMKILFISVTMYILYLFHLHPVIKKTYNRSKNDTFPHYYLLIFAFVMALFIHRSWSPLKFLISFSLWLESVAIFPQILILSMDKYAENFLAHYLACLGSYRIFYVILWIYRYVTMKYILWDAILAGIIQVLLYADFFYLYFQNIKRSITSELPVSGKVGSERNEGKRLF